MSSDIKTHADGHAVRFTPAGEGRWTVLHAGRSYEVERRKARDEHGWMRNSFSMRRTDASGEHVGGLADLTAVARTICEVAC